MQQACVCVCARCYKQCSACSRCALSLAVRHMCQVCPVNVIQASPQLPSFGACSNVPICIKVCRVHNESCLHQCTMCSIFGLSIFAQSCMDTIDTFERHRANPPHAPLLKLLLRTGVVLCVCAHVCACARVRACMHMCVWLCARDVWQGRISGKGGRLAGGAHLLR